MSSLKGTVLPLLVIIYNVLVRYFAGLSRPQYVQGFKLFGVDGPLARSAIDVRAYVRSERVGVRDREYLVAGASAGLLRFTGYAVLFYRCSWQPPARPHHADPVCKPSVRC